MAIGFIVMAIVGCVSIPLDVRQKMSGEYGYGMITIKTDGEKEFINLEVCNKIERAEVCNKLQDYDEYHALVAASYSDGWFGVYVLVPKSTKLTVGSALKNGDIIKFRITSADSYLKGQAMAARFEGVTQRVNENNDLCHWEGNRYVGFPGMKGGMVCNGWSYKDVTRMWW